MAAGTSTGQRRARQPGGRGVRVVVRLSPAEYATVTGHAAELGLTVPSYLAALGLAPHTVAAELLRVAVTHAAALRRVLALTADRLTHTTDADATDADSESIAGLLASLAARAETVLGELTAATPKRGPTRRTTPAAMAPAGAMQERAR